MNSADKPIDFFPHRKRSYKLDEPMHPVQLEGFRRMTPAEKFEMMARMYRGALELRIAGERMRHPDWSEEQLASEARRAMLHART